VINLVKNIDITPKGVIALSKQASKQASKQERRYACYLSISFLLETFFVKRRLNARGGLVV